MAELKTTRTGASVTEFIAGIEDERQRKDSKTLVKLMKSVTNSAPKMWGPSIVGFGSYRYEYASGRTGDWMLTGFSPRKGKLSIYVMSGFKDEAPLMSKLGKYTSGKSCLNVKRLDDVDLKVLEQLVSKSVAYMKKTYKTS